MKAIKNLPAKMKALIAFGPGDFRYEVCDMPQINENEILIKSLGCGICAGDIKSYHGAAMFWATATCRNGKYRQFAADTNFLAKW